MVTSCQEFEKLYSKLLMSLGGEVHGHCVVLEVYLKFQVATGQGIKKIKYANWS